LGGHIGGSLIHRHKLLSKKEGGRGVDDLVYTDSARQPDPTPLEESESEHSALLGNTIAIAVAMGLGTLISACFQRMGLILPVYVGAMIAAAIIRNLDDRFHFARINQHEVDKIALLLYIFIVMALLTPGFGTGIPGLAYAGDAGGAGGPDRLMRGAGLSVMGRDYESAVMVGGFCALCWVPQRTPWPAWMRWLENSGPAPRAFVVVPVVGSFLIDFANALIITTMANLFR
jgi:ESS family glutamate:Na+ symporter